MASARGTGFAVDLSTNGPDLPDLFVHRFALPKIILIRRALKCDIGSGEGFLKYQRGR